MQPLPLPSKLRSAFTRVRGSAWLLLPPLCLALISGTKILELTGGEPSVPLDDAYIHFQFARSFADFEPFVYTHGTAAVPGASSLLWPLLLAPFLFFGLKGLAVIWVAWALGWLSFALLGCETWKVSKDLLSPAGAVVTTAAIYAFGAFTWFAASGMEVLPLAWVLMRVVRRLSEWWEADSPAGRSQWVELLLLSATATWLRPEGAVAAIASAVTLVLRPRALARYTALLMVVPALVPPLVNALATGHATPTTALVKWLAFNPYYDAAAVVRRVFENIGLFFGTLANGEIWSAVFVPRGSGPFVWCALPALLALGARSRRVARATWLVVFALGILIPASYDSFLVNRLRYLWPFAAPWLVGVGAVSELLGALVAPLIPASRARLRTFVAPLAMSGVVMALALRIPDSIDDLAISADAIYRQQVALGRWARDTLPKGARLGVNDAGAIAYLSGRETFDVVGLTTLGEAAPWIMGPGSRFEHYEHLGRAKLPTHFIVYPEWFALDALLGNFLTEREIPGATILGGPRMAAHLADYRLLGTGARPINAPESRLVDELDVADLESERAHSYRLHGTNQTENRLAQSEGRADGGRFERAQEDFQLGLEGGGILLLRLGAETRSTLDLQIHDRDAATVIWQSAVELTGVAWQEIRLDLPKALGKRAAEISVRGRSTRFAAFHYWSYASLR